MMNIGLTRRQRSLGVPGLDISEMIVEARRNVVRGAFSLFVAGHLRRTQTRPKLRRTPSTISEVQLA
jgi:hypothetical protein